VQLDRLLLERDRLFLEQQVVLLQFVALQVLRSLRRHEVRAETGIAVGRASLRTRSSANTPPGWVDAWLRALRFSNREREATLLVLHHADAPSRARDAVGARRFLRAVGPNEAFWLLETLEAIALGEGDEGSGLWALRDLRTRAAQVLEASDPIDLKALAITGADVMRVSGRGAGRYVGAVLERLLDEVLEDPRRNVAQELLSRARELSAEEAP
jgi:hypothetical protein